MPSILQIPFRIVFYIVRDIAPYRDNLGSSAVGTYRDYQIHHANHLLQLE
jgi:hypothetical protein